MNLRQLLKYSYIYQSIPKSKCHACYTPNFRSAMIHKHVFHISSRQQAHVTNCSVVPKVNISFFNQQGSHIFSF